MSTEKTRFESDSMGQVAIPHWAYWGAQTQRAVENFGVSKERISPSMIKALGLIKRSAARANKELGIVDDKLARTIIDVGGEVVDGRWNDHFPIDVFQTGSGTSWNMNVNEVIANRSNELLGSPLGTRSPVHPNDHVNRGQSSNDVIPTAVHVANRMSIVDLLEGLQALLSSLDQKALQFSDIVKLGRTHLQDAVPMTLGQEFSGFADQIRKGIRRIENTLPHLEELALGGTAVGTGINCHPDFPGLAIGFLGEETGLPFRPAENRFEAIASRDAQVELMGALNVVAVSFMKIANDLRLLAGGPRGGLGEIILPTLQPGSSIMPGKINPVIPEMVIQAAAYVMGKAVSVTTAGQNAPLQLNMMHPLIAMETEQSISLLANTSRVLADRCIDGIEADTERMTYWLEWSLALVTPLANRIGYDQAATLAYRAYREKRPIREVVIESQVLPESEVQEILDPRNMLQSGR